MACADSPRRGGGSSSASAVIAHVVATSARESWGRSAGQRAGDGGCGDASCNRRSPSGLSLPGGIPSSPAGRRCGRPRMRFLGISRDRWRGGGGESAADRGHGRRQRRRCQRRPAGSARGAWSACSGARIARASSASNPMLWHDRRAGEGDTISTVVPPVMLVYAPVATQHARRRLNQRSRARVAHHGEARIRGRRGRIVGAEEGYAHTTRHGCGWRRTRRAAVHVGRAGSSSGVVHAGLQYEK